MSTPTTRRGNTPEEIADRDMRITSKLKAIRARVYKVHNDAFNPICRICLNYLSTTNMTDVCQFCAKKHRPMGPRPLTVYRSR